MAEKPHPQSQTLPARRSIIICNWQAQRHTVHNTQYSPLNNVYIIHVLVRSPSCSLAKKTAFKPIQIQCLHTITDFAMFHVITHAHAGTHNSPVSNFYR